MKKFVLALIVGALLAACSSEPPAAPPLKLDYSALGKIYLNTQDLKVINRADSVAQKPSNIVYQFKPKLSEAVMRWAQDRMQATGSVGHATLIIKEASVTEKALPMETGMSSWFKRQQATKLMGRIEVDIDAQSPVNSTTGKATAHAIQAVTLPEEPTNAERDAAYRELLQNLMEDLNRQLDQAVRQHMAPFLGAANAAPGMQMQPQTMQPPATPQPYAKPGASTLPQLPPLPQLQPNED